MQQNIRIFYESNPKFQPTFLQSLNGRNVNFYETNNIVSPNSSRVLKPFIFREPATGNSKLLLLTQLYNKFHPTTPRLAPPTIDYCYLQPSLLMQTNQLLATSFWPGIDVSECLKTPEHTVVVLMMRMVIGCGFITPDGYITYLCVNPEWRNHKIGKLILYQLIQSCPDKDITLHVSVSNPAMVLYNKFGFKPEEFINDFYNKYYDDASNFSKHAFFLRLRR